MQTQRNKRILDFINKSSRSSKEMLQNQLECPSVLKSWCHNCGKQTLSKYLCQHCSSEAVEEISESTASSDNVTKFQPYQLENRNALGGQSASSQGQELLSMEDLVRRAFPSFFAETHTLMQNASISYQSQGGVSVARLSIDVGAEEAAQRGLSEEQIEIMQRRIIQQQCAVCQELESSCNQSSLGLILPCGHEFHEDCLMPWLRQHSRCPTCRSCLRQV